MNQDQVWRWCGTLPGAFSRPDYIDVWSNDLDAYLSNRYHRPWSLAACREVGQDGWIMVDVSGEPDARTADTDERMDELLVTWWRLPYDPPAEVNAKPPYDYYWEHENPIDVEILLWGECTSGTIPAGKYLIRVWW